MYGLSAGTKKSGRCREVAVVERWPSVEVQLYFDSEGLIWSTETCGGGGDGGSNSSSGVG